jgi:hypothetical protein
MFIFGNHPNWGLGPAVCPLLTLYSRVPSVLPVYMPTPQLLGLWTLLFWASGECGARGEDGRRKEVKPRKKWVPGQDNTVSYPILTGPGPTQPFFQCEVWAACLGCFAPCP